MAQILSHNSHDFMPVEIVPVIASFDNDGHIKPLYVRIGGESYKVDSYWVRKNYANQMEFHCKLIIHNFLRPIIITYFVNECIWTIPKGG